MALVHPGQGPEPEAAILSLRVAAGPCVNRFQQCISKDHNHTSTDESTWIDEQFVRFRVWYTNLGVFADGNASLDYRLRDCDEIRSLLLQLLHTLQRNLDLSTPSRTGKPLKMC